MINEKFIIKLNGKDFVTYEGLLHRAHEKGLKSIKVDLIELPTSQNEYTAIALATVEGINGEVFIDLGDASSKSVNSKITPHIIRMASTRAKARALRDFTNVGMTAFEELNPNEIEVVKPATVPQINLLKKLSKELNIRVDFNELDKQSASQMIDEFSKAKREYKQRKAN